ncbi:MAG: aspartate aminotransferase family protein [Pseudomonadota bacterium]
MNAKFNFDDEMQFLATGMTPGYLNAPRQFSHGAGALLFDERGREYIDFCSGTLTNIAGHSHSEITHFMQKRIAELWNIHDYSSPYRLSTLKLINDITPNSIDTYEFYSSGSETIEAGLRALLSYLPKNKQRFCSFSGGFHGKTLGARQIINWRLEGEYFEPTFQIPFPDKIGISASEKHQLEDKSLTIAKKLFSQHPSIGAFIFEPIQGASGCLQASKTYWSELKAICSQYNILFFADEVCVGLGRTGKNFAVNHYNIEPDLIAFAKGLGNGFPVMCLGGRKAIMNASPYGDPGGASTTFGGNPLAIGAIYATLSTYNKETLVLKTKPIEELILARLKMLSIQSKIIDDFRCIGAFATIAFKSDQYGIAVHKKCIELELKSFTFGNLFRIVPPLVITKKQIQKGLDILTSAIEFVEKN